MQIFSYIRVRDQSTRPTRHELYHPHGPRSTKLNAMNRIKKMGPLYIILMAYFILYVLFLEPWNWDGFSNITPEYAAVYILFLLFLVGFSLAWKYPVVTGVIFFVWNAGMYVLEGFFVEKDGGFGIIAGLPLLAMGVLFIIHGTREKDAKPDVRREWSLSLKLLAAVFTALYVIFGAGNYFTRPGTYLHEGGIYFLLALFVLYLCGIIISQRNELLGGILLIIWYGCLLVLGIVFSELEFERLAGLAVLLLGLMLVYYDKDIKKRYPSAGKVSPT